MGNLVGIFEYLAAQVCVGQDFAALSVDIHGTDDADHPTGRGSQQHRHAPHCAIADHQRRGVANEQVAHLAHQPAGDLALGGLGVYLEWR